MELHHISDSDLERYYIGTIRGPELAVLNEHLDWCALCSSRLSVIAAFDSSDVHWDLVTGGAHMTRSVARPDW